ncbi:Uncharacterised protein [Mycobacterium tuberculosis]|nr:Uncharacterised protein [Mycobacterium tuberculosis]COX60186.1 Uncharacterised protein [Mycobacterium tuberculosis]
MSTVTIDPSTGAAVAAGPARFPGLTGCAVGTRPALAAIAAATP